MVGCGKLKVLCTEATDTICWKIGKHEVDII